MKLPSPLEKKLYAARTLVRSALSTPVGIRLMDHRPDDQYVAAFPRSGSTWLRTMLVNIVDPTAHSNPTVFNQTIPSTSIRNTPLVRSRPSPRILMTHSSWRKPLKRVVYVVRDGRDSLVSFYHYVIIRAGRTESFEEFFRMYEKNVFATRWDQHVMSWFGPGARRLEDNLRIVHFEDLKRATDEVLQNVVEFLGLDSSAELRERAIEEASLANMRQIERRRRGEVKNGASFYRSGKVGGWRDLLNGPLLDRFLANGGERALRVAGYEP